MKNALVRRLERLEERRSVWHRTNQPLSTFEIARLVCSALRQGAEARKELDAADASLSPSRRAELTKTIEGVRKVAAMLKKHDPAKEVELTNEEMTTWQLK